MSGDPSPIVASGAGPPAAAAHLSRKSQSHPRLTSSDASTGARHVRGPPGAATRGGRRHLVGLTLWICWRRRRKIGNPTSCQSGTHA